MLMTNIWTNRPTNLPVSSQPTTNHTRHLHHNQYIHELYSKQIK